MTVEFVHAEEIYFPVDIIKALHIANRRAKKSDGTDNMNMLVTQLNTDDIEAILTIINDRFAGFEFVELEVGLTYYYTEARPDHIRDLHGNSRYNYYQITQIADNTVVLKRLNENGKGGANSTFVESRAKVTQDLLTGRAIVYNDRIINGDGYSFGYDPGE